MAGTVFPLLAVPNERPHVWWTPWGDALQQEKGVNKTDFLRLMRFPPEWESWGLYPDELFIGQLSLYRPGDEAGSEHDRNGAFHWWLKRSPSKDVLVKLLLLADKDRDPLMAADVRQRIIRAMAAS
jgi:hypothetical protein